MKNTKAILVATAVAVFLSACSAPKEVSFQTLEDNRAQGRANAEFNAQAYRAENPRLQGMNIVTHGDSTQSPECPQGDGWASLSIMNVDKVAKTVEKYKIKCSTVSAALGCYTEEDFQKKPFSSDEGQCQKVTKVPFPLPKIAK